MGGHLRGLMASVYFTFAAGKGTVSVTALPERDR